MTQPTSVDMTFDTSLVDLNPNASFSTTESDPSDFGTINPSKTPTLQQTSLFEEQSQDTPKQSQALSAGSMAAPPKPATPVQHIPTQEAYDQWASIYDSDGNMLQSIDDVELEMLLPGFLTSVLDRLQSTSVSLLDLGCGTGRNTAKLLSYAWPQNRRVSVTGLDFSRGMLDVAERKLRPLNESKRDGGKSGLALRLECCDCFPTVNDSTASPFPAVSGLTPVDAVLSTLVLEHIPLTPFFATLHSLLAPDGVALVTNMHAQMGRISQAGFINAEGVKVRGSSFAHSVEETVEAARQWGFEVLDVKERAMAKGDVQSGRVGERGLKWVNVKVWYCVVLRKVGG